MRDAAFWLSEWNSSSYLKQKRESFRALDAAVSTPPRRVLDIGAGLAYEAEWLQRRYGCQLYLLDGDMADSAGTRDVGFGAVRDFRFYQPLQQLRESWEQRGLSYRFIDAAEPQVDGVFDMVYSSLSCGFHYPISAYDWLLSKHTDDATVMVFDIRQEYYKRAATDYRIVKVLQHEEKYKKCLIKLK